MLPELGVRNTSKKQGRRGYGVGHGKARVPGEVIAALRYEGKWLPQARLVERFRLPKEYVYAVLAWYVRAKIEPAPWPYATYPDGARVETFPPPAKPG